VADLFTASIDSAHVLELFDRLAQSAQFVTLEVSRGTADRIVREAQARIRRATGESASEIHWELTRDGAGYVVLGYRQGGNEGLVDKYLEFGTKYQYARPFFFSSAELEEGPHMRRLVDRMQEWLSNVGR
jgi:hypothetical protein